MKVCVVGGGDVGLVTPLLLDGRNFSDPALMKQLAFGPRALVQERAARGAAL